PLPSNEDVDQPEERRTDQRYLRQRATPPSRAAQACVFQSHADRCVIVPCCCSSCRNRHERSGCPRHVNSFGLVTHATRAPRRPPTLASSRAGFVAASSDLAEAPLCSASHVWPGCNM